MFERTRFLVGSALVRAGVRILGIEVPASSAEIEDDDDTDEVPMVPVTHTAESLRMIQEANGPRVPDPPPEQPKYLAGSVAERRSRQVGFHHPARGR